MPFNNRAMTASRTKLSSASREAHSAGSIFGVRRRSPQVSRSRFGQTRRRQPRGGEGSCRSLMTIPPRRARVRGGDAGSGLTGRSWLLGVVGGADPNERDTRAESEEEEVEAMHHGIHELPLHRETDNTLGGICRTGKFPAWMRSRTARRVSPRALHQRCRPVALLRNGIGYGPSYEANSRMGRSRKNCVHAP
jgi:hypothetical protein